MDASKMDAARKVAVLKQIPLLLVERDGQIVGTIDERAFATDYNLAAVAATAMTPLGACLRPWGRAGRGCGNGRLRPPDASSAR